MRDKEKQREYSRAWYKKNRDKILAKRRQWYLSNVDVANKKVYDWISENKEARATHQARYWAKYKARKNK